MRMRLVVVVAVMLVGGKQALAQTTGELLAQCEQLERTWVIQGNHVSIRAGERLGELLPIGNVRHEATAHRHLSIGADGGGDVSGDGWPTGPAPSG
jgi:hypothetical protein